MDARADCIYEFGDFRLLPREKQLLFQGTAIPLPPKVFDTLVLLVERHGSLIEKDDLLKTLWPETFVEEVALAHNISQLRKALRGLAPKNEFIETVPKRGYRFVSPVREVSGEAIRTGVDTAASLPATTSAPEHTQRSYSAFVIGAAIVIGTISAIWLARSDVRSQSRPVSTSIGILPFAVIPTDDAVAHLGAGLSDALIVRLHRLRSVAVRPASAVASFDPMVQDPVRFGKALKVDNVLTGRIQRDSTKIRVNASLIRIADGTVLWAEELDEPLANLLAIEDSIATRIVDSLAASATHEEQRVVAKRGTSVPAAHDAYLRGRYLWTRRSSFSAESLRKALRYHEEAVRLDPQYALAWAGLGDTYRFLDDFVDRSKEDVLTPARAAAAKAIALDATLAQPHATLGLIAMNVDWNWSEAERQYGAAIALDPSYATAHAWLGEFLAYMGRFDEGLAELRTAHELDPLSPVIGGDVAKVLMLARRYPEAIEQLTRMVEIDPAFARHHEYLYGLYFLSGRYDAALKELDTVRTMLHSAADDPGYLAARIDILAAAGRTNEARAALSQLVAVADQRFVPPTYLAHAYGAMGDLDIGFKFIDRMIDRHGWGVLGLKVAPEWDPYRRDPRFDRVLARVGFTR